jgi:hypothetical protein
MKPKGLLIAVVLLAVLGGAVWFSNRSRSAKSEDTAGHLLSIPADQIQQIQIKKLTGEVQRITHDTGRWTITEPKQLAADPDTVEAMVNGLANLNLDKVVEEKASDLAPYGLSTPTLDVEVKRKDGKTDRLLIGDDIPTGSGAYAKLANDPRVVTISSVTKATLDKRIEDLREKRLLPFDPDKLTRVSLASKGQVVEFGRNAQGQWQIIRPVPLRTDVSAVEALVTKLKDAKLDPFATEDAAKEFNNGSKVATVSVTDASGTQTLEVRRDSVKNVYVKSSLVEGYWKTSADLAEAVEHGINDFRNRKLFDFGFSDPTQLQIQGVTYTKNGDKWMSGGKVMNNTSIQVVIDKMRDLMAGYFAESTKPGEKYLELSVTSDSGQRVEKVTIFRKDADYWAQREGDNSIYILDIRPTVDLHKAVEEIREATPEPAKKK